ncbi:MAG: polysaccharide biosynthesis/export family protein [Leptolyngbyaceae cyanobacterium bins.59]|nr:polysaccharide biosynthesis/export family protein [Leptolyngbyaceae cyanobacterium bins.59]
MAQLPALVNSPTNNQQAVPPTEAIPASMEPQKTGNASPEVDPMNRLKSGDRIRLVVTGFPDFSGEQVILADGTLQLPLVGSIVVAGLSPADAVTTITTSLRPYIRRPQVGLAVVSIRPPRISVTGEVVRPGPRLLTPPPNAFNPNAATENFQTLSFALVQAGGVTPNADLRNIIIRRVISGSTDLGLQTTVPKSEIKVDLWQAIQRGDLSGDPRLVDGDEVIVPTAPVARSEQRQLLSSTVAPLAITVQIAGEVRRPGTVQISPIAGASAAVAAAGGPTDKARTDSMTLLRVSEDGRLERQEFAFGNNTVQLKDGDVIVVDKSFFSSTLETLSNIINPLTPFLFLFGR